MIERRDVPLRDVIVGKAAARTGRTIRGRAIVYGALSEDLGGFRERFAPGAIDLANTGDLLVLFGHDHKYVLGRTSAGTARAHDDGEGVIFEATPPDTTWARDLMVSLERGDVSQCSFAFRVIEDDYHYDAILGIVVRTVLSAELMELSVVSMPAYTQTSAYVS